MMVRSFAEVPAGKVFYALNKRSGEKRRCYKYGDYVFVYGKRMKRYGYQYDYNRFNEHYTFCPYNDDENASWHRRVRRALKCIKASGLWPDMIEYFENLDKMTWEDKQYLDHIYWQGPHFGISGNMSWDEFNDICKKYAERYPFVFDIDEKGNYRINTKYIWEMSDCKLKSMYFGKYQNAHEKALIAQKIANKERYSCAHEVNYDVSFEYNPTMNAAWYSEEYRGCANGHYYLALNSSTALFCEDD